MKPVTGTATEVANVETSLDAGDVDSAKSRSEALARACRALSPKLWLEPETVWARALTAELLLVRLEVDAAARVLAAYLEEGEIRGLRELQDVSVRRNPSRRPAEWREPSRSHPTP